MTFLALWLALVAQRLEEVARARRNTAALKQRGAREWASGHYPLMVALHTLWFVCWLGETPHPGWNPGWLAPALAGQLLRAWTQATLGSRWTTRVLTVPRELPVTNGPFRYFRHPNYLGVCLELLSFPMLTGAWRTAVVFSLLNAALLSHRVRCEEAAWKSGS